MEKQEKVKYIVVDAGGFIRNAPLKDIGVNIVTLGDVVREIKDKATRQRLQVLPYELQFREPSPESIKIVTDFAKKTGDYRTLSAVDIRVMALTYQLEKEYVGTDHIRMAPEKKIEWNTTTRHLENPAEIAGFYLGKKNAGNSRLTSVSQDSGVGAEDLAARVHEVRLENVPEGAAAAAPVENGTTATESTKTDTENTQENEKGTLEESNEKDDGDIDTSEDAEKENKSDGVSRRALQDGDAIPSSRLEEADSDDSQDEDGDEEEDDDDDDGWITPSNIRDVRKAMGDTDMDKATVTVGCLTTDFSMQNVLIQMGLNVISTGGLLIKKAKSYVLRCFACMKVTTKTQLEFCPHCGNKTLQRVSMSVNDDGSIRYYLSKRRPISTRGMRYSLPKPQGGKHAQNPILCADQPGPQQRMSKSSKAKYNPFDPDYFANESPFAPVDVYSRSAQLGIRSQSGHHKKRMNPNENKKVYGRRK